jgi:hypothetical protein
MQWRRPVKVDAEWWEEFREAFRAARTADALVDFFSRRTWQAFHTGTFSRPVSGSYCQRSFSRFLADVPWRSTVKTALWASEPHPGGHGSHSHALISFTASMQSRLWAEWRTGSRGSCGGNSTSRRGSRGISTRRSPTWTMLYREWKESWYAKWGRCRIYPVRNQRAMLTRYVLKYVLKETIRTRTGTLRGAPPPWDKEPLTRQNDVDWGIILL